MFVCYMNVKDVRRCKGSVLQSGCGKIGEGKAKAEVKLKGATRICETVFKINPNNIIKRSLKEIVI
jgi:hypothetical protein